MGGREGGSFSLCFSNETRTSRAQITAKRSGETARFPPGVEGTTPPQGTLSETYLLLALRRRRVRGRTVWGGRVHLHRLLLLYFDVWGRGQGHVQGSSALREKQPRIERTISSHCETFGRSQRKSPGSEPRPNYYYYYLFVLKEHLGARSGERCRAVLALSKQRRRPRQDGLCPRWHHFVVSQ